MSERDLAPIVGETVSVEILRVGRGHALAWSAPWGAAASIVSRYAPEYARPAIALGTAHRTRTDAPRLFPVADGIAAVWCQDDGAWLAVIDADGAGLVREPSRMLAGGRSLCVAAGARESHVFVEDGEHVRVITVGSDARSVVHREPLLVQRGRVQLAAARAGETPLLFASYAEDRRLIIADGARGRGSVVRHELPSACSGLDAHAIGGRAAFVVGYERERVAVGLADAACTLVERPHVVLREPGALYTHVRVVWMEDAFHVIARDGRHDRVSAVAFGSTKATLTVPRVSGPFAVAHHGARLVLAQAFAENDDSVLRITHCSVDGSGLAVFDVREPPPPTLRVRRAEEQVAQRMDELERMLGATGYRDTRAVRVDVERGAALRLDDDTVQLELRPDGEAFRVSIVALRERGRATARGGRLGRWLRDRVSREGRRIAARDRELGARLADAIEGELARVQQTERGWRCEIRLARVPSAQLLRGWLVRAREMLVTRGD